MLTLLQTSERAEYFPSGLKLEILGASVGFLFIHFLINHTDVLQKSQQLATRYACRIKPV